MYQIMLIMVTGLMRLWKKVASIAGDVLYVIQNLLPGSIDKDETSDTGDIYSIRSLEKPKDLKALVKSYYKSLKFIPSQFYRTSGGLRFLDSLLNVALKPYYVEEPSKHLPSQHSNPVGDDDEIVGFYIATEKVIWHLTRGTSELDVIPTVEMGQRENDYC
ncbi:hypothetical protein FXO37_01808 [Capsicum annuum]|nr:hypothetical protein FXO37_01808 [Capsicum annuum]